MLRFSIVWFTLLATRVVAEIKTNISPIPFYAASNKYPYTQLVFANSVVYASITDTPTGAFPISCSPEVFNTSSLIHESRSRVLCVNSNIGNPNKPKYALYFDGPIGKGTEDTVQLRYAPEEQNTKDKMQVLFNFAVGPMMFYSGPEVNRTQRNDFLADKEGKIRWATKNWSDGYGLAEGENWLGISIRQMSSWGI